MQRPERVFALPMLKIVFPISITTDLSTSGGFRVRVESRESVCTKQRPKLGLFSKSVDPCVMIRLRHLDFDLVAHIFASFETGLGKPEVLFCAFHAISSSGQCPLLVFKG